MTFNSIFEDRRIQLLTIWMAVSLVFVLPLWGFVYRQNKVAAMRSSSIASAMVQQNAQDEVVTAGGAKESESKIPVVTKAVSTTKATISRSTTLTGSGLDPTQAALALQIIARCESSNNPLAKNSHSSAKGLLQIIDGTWSAFGCTGNVYDRVDNMRCGMKIATESGLHHWNASRSCWIGDVRSRISGV